MNRRNKIGKVCYRVKDGATAQNEDQPSRMTGPDLEKQENKRCNSIFDQVRAAYIKWVRKLTRATPHVGKKHPWDVLSACSQGHLLRAARLGDSASTGSWGEMNHIHLRKIKEVAQWLARKDGLLNQYESLIVAACDEDEFWSWFIEKEEGAPIEDRRTGLRMLGNTVDMKASGDSRRVQVAIGQLHQERKSIEQSAL